MAEVEKLNSVTLLNSVTIDGKKVRKISLRKPRAGELRGLAVSEIVRMEVNSLIKLIPRISTPHFSEEQVGKLDPSELMDFGAKITTFFVKPAQMADLDLTITN